MKDRGIQAIRGCACIMVFLSHFIGTFPNGFFIGNYNMQTSPFRIIWGGNAAVIIFFVLSGYFSYRENKYITFHRYIKLQIKRHLRIYPIFLVTMVIALIAMETCIAFDATEISSWAASFWSKKSTNLEYLKNFVLLRKLQNSNCMKFYAWIIA